MNGWLIALIVVLEVFVGLPLLFIGLAWISFSGPPKGYSGSGPLSEMLPPDVKSPAAQ